MPSTRYHSRRSHNFLISLILFASAMLTAIRTLPRSSVRSALFLRSFSATALRTAPNGKVYQSAEEAVDVVKSDDILLTGGFGLCGIPSTLIQALAKRKDEVKGLTGVSNNAGVEEKGLGLLLQTGQVSKLIASYVGA